MWMVAAETFGGHYGKRDWASLVNQTWQLLAKNDALHRHVLNFELVVQR